MEVLKQICNKALNKVSWRCQRGNLRVCVLRKSHKVVGSLMHSNFGEHSLKGVCGCVVFCERS